MDFHQIKCFLSAAHHLNFTVAARECYIAQQGLSQQIQAMENELGFKLFIRNNRSVQLTAAGKVFLEDTEHLYALYKKTLAKSRAAAAGMRGDLSIGYGLCYHHVFFSDDQIFNFMNDNPDIRLSFKKDDSEVLVKLLVQSLLDIIFASRKCVEPIEDQMDFLTLGYTPLAVVMSPNHPLAGQETFQPAQMQNEILFFSKIAETICQPYLLKYNIKPKEIRRVDNFSTQMMMATANSGITIMPYCARIALVNNLHFIPIAGADDEIEVCAIWKKDNSNPTLPFFIKMLADSL